MKLLLHDVFIESVKKAPHATAITTESGRTITYSELNMLANKFTHTLNKSKKNFGVNPFVGILSYVHIESIAAVLGILKCGGTYVPLDEHSPAERLEKILCNAAIDTICIDGTLFEKYQELLCHHSIKSVIVINQYKIPDHELKSVVTFDTVLCESSQEPPYHAFPSDNLAYVLHSSGSTGVPKGIMLTHRNARTFVDWMHKEFSLTSQDIVASRAPFKFDLSVFDIFNTFKAGAQLVCFDWHVKRTPERVHQEYTAMLERHNVTTLYTTPSTFISLLNRGNLAQRRLTLRTVMYAGEPFQPAQLRALMEALPHTRVANIYGPTETNIIT